LALNNEKGSVWKNQGCLPNSSNLMELSFVGFVLAGEVTFLWLFAVFSWSWLFDFGHGSTSYAQG
jgi:hypothetical protein